MANPILSMLHTQNEQQTQTSSLPKVNKQMSFAQFVKLMKGKDPKAIVDELHASGQMSDQQYNSLVQEAGKKINTFRAFLD